MKATSFCCWWFFFDKTDFLSKSRIIFRNFDHCSNNLIHNILEIFNISEVFLFPTSKTVLDIFHEKHSTSYREWLKSENLWKWRNIRKKSKLGVESLMHRSPSTRTTIAIAVKNYVVAVLKVFCFWLAYLLCSKYHGIDWLHD